MSVESLVPRFLRIHKARINRYWVWPEHTNRETELVLIKKGKMRCSIDHIGFVGRDSDLYFVQPGQLHCEEILGEHLDIFTLRFDLLDATGESQGFLADCPPRRQRLNNAEKWSGRLFEQILHLVWNERPGTESKIEALILEIIGCIKHHCEIGKPTPEVERMPGKGAVLAERAASYVERNLQRKVSVSEVAKYCCVSPCHLTHVFKAVLGVSPIRYIQQMRVDRAKRLLADESLYVYEIAREIGFDDPFYFSRMFKRISGVSPGEFRTHIRRASL
jgi:AraC-like DNA-binding protein